MIMGESETLKIYALQTPLLWLEPDQNLLQFEKKMENLAVDGGLIILPEMFTTGFTMHPEKVAVDPDSITKWLVQQAAKWKAAITGSVAVKEGGFYYNRMYFVTPEGGIYNYDKRHLFSLAGEEKVYQPGSEKVVVVWRGWRILLQVCYDLRFPIFSRNTKVAPYDLALYVANWPAIRSFAWQHLLIARAIENQCYVVGVNRTGTDGNGHAYEGASGIIDFAGGHLCGPCFDEQAVLSTTLQKEALYAFRNKFRFLNDGDEGVIFM